MRTKSWQTGCGSVMASQGRAVALTIAILGCAAP
jgi:hypothetical protein